MRKADRYRPVSIVPFKLYNIEDFVVGSYPVYYPDSAKYDEFWMGELKTCLEGKWGFDFDKKTGLGGWRWMPGNLYFYTNMGIINQAADENKIEMAPPLLRDIEWLIFYGLTVCDGFSGFAEDATHCCFRPLGKLQLGLPLDVIDELFIEKYGHLYRDKKGNYKKYIEPKEYLYRVHKGPLGIPMYNNIAQNFEILSTRRLGKSFIIGEGVATYDFTFNGARTIDDYLNGTSKSTVVIGSADYKYGAELIDKVEMAYENIRLNIGSYYKDGLEINGVFWHPIGGLGKGFKDKGGSISNAVADKSGQGKEGVGSKIVHVSYKDNASAGVGYGARRMIVDEVGLLENFETVHSENNATQKHDIKYGISIYAGTGGNVLKIKGVKDSFYNPEKYDILGYPNVFSPGSKDTALFVPVYYKNNNFRDENGNLDIERSFKSEMQERDKKRGGKGYQGHTISFPMIPAEMFMKSAGNRFNTEALENRIIELEEGAYKYNVGSLMYVDQQNKVVAWDEDIEEKLKPFLRRGDELDVEDKRGAIVVYEHPQPYKPSSRYSPNPLYIALYDPVGIDDVNGEGGGTSLCAVIILKLFDFNDSYFMLNVVAEWYGRHKEMNDNHKTAFMLSDYYGCMLFPETNHEDILRYAKSIRRYEDLEDRPSYSAAEVANQKRNYVKGFGIPPNGKPKLEEFLNELLETAVYKEELLDKTEHKVTEIRVVNRIPSIRVCEELKDYNSDDNFDAVSCLFLGALYIRNKNLKPIVEDSDISETAEINEFVNYFNNADANYRHPAFNY